MISVLMQRIINVMKNSPETVCFLDVETTGFSHDRHVIELGIVDIHGEVLVDERFNTKQKINYHASKVHGIWNNDLLYCPYPPEFDQQLLCFLADKNVICYNAKFDIASMENNFKSIDFINNNYCLMNAYSDWRRYTRAVKLVKACEEMNVRINDVKNHHAAGDAIKTQRLAVSILNNYL